MEKGARCGAKSVRAQQIIDRQWQCWQVVIRSKDEREREKKEADSGMQDDERRCEVGCSWSREMASAGVQQCNQLKRDGRGGDGNG